jgi:penicillin-binding protein 1A
MARPNRQKKQQPRGNGRQRNERAAPPRKPRKSGRRWLRRLVVWSLVLAIWLGVAAAGVIVYYAHDIPDVDKVAEATRKPSVTLLAQDGTVLASYGKLYGESVSLEDVPPVLPKAVMAAEDRRFYSHFGIDPFGLARAMVANVRAGGIVQGGSTITQQLAKNLFLTPERTVKRKVQELILAFWLEHRFSKDRILALYLNRVYLGAGTYGVDAAARRYFGKPASEVNLYESALLAGLLKAPSRYNPTSDPDAAHRRAVIVLQDMVEAGYITEADAKRAASRRSQGQAVAAWSGRYFADWVLGEVRDYVGYHSKDLVVRTTLDRPLQRVAEANLRKLLAEKGAERDARQAALVMMTPTGSVRAMVGGRDYRESQFNRATQAMRQPGSAFKPFVYLAGMEDGLTPDHQMEDRPIRVDGWSPDNYAGRYHGRVTLREAFARSLNSVAVQVLQRVGAEKVAETAHRLGISADLKAHPSLALGTSEVSLLELTGAYAVFANRGHAVFPHGIEEIRDSEGRVLYRRQSSGTGRVVQPRHLQRVTDLLRANVEWGTGKSAAPGRPAAGKTGTSQDFRDAWFIGFTAELVTGVWVGNDDGRPMDLVTGGSLPAQLWHRTTVAALKGQPPQPLPGMEIRVAESAPSDEGGGDGGLISRIIRSLGGNDDPAEVRRAPASESRDAGSSSDYIQRGR